MRIAGRDSANFTCGLRKDILLTGQDQDRYVGCDCCLFHAYSPRNLALRFSKNAFTPSA